MKVHFNYLIEINSSKQQHVYSMTSLYLCVSASCVFCRRGGWQDKLSESKESQDQHEARVSRFMLNAFILLFLFSLFPSGVNTQLTPVLHLSSLLFSYSLMNPPNYCHYLLAGGSVMQHVVPCSDPVMYWRSKVSWWDIFLLVHLIVLVIRPPEEHCVLDLVPRLHKHQQTKDPELVPADISSL